MKYNYLKQSLIAATLTLLTTACSEKKSHTEEAEGYYNTAQQLYEQQRYSAAKLQVDSIELLFPKEFETIRKGNMLLRHIHLAESERNLAFTDSLIPLREEALALAKKAFIYESEEDSPNEGRYIYPSQQIEKNLRRSYIRCNTDSQGNLQLASVYYGSSALHHSALRFETTDGGYAQTDTIPFDGGMNYRFDDMGATTEVVTYQKGRQGSAFELVSSYPDAAIRVIYQGGKRAFQFNLDKTTRKAMNETYKLALAMQEIEALKQAQQQSIRQIEALKKRIADTL